MRYTLPAVPETKTFRLARAIDVETRGIQKADCEAAIVNALDRLAKRLHIPDIAMAGVTKEAIPAMSEDALLELSTPTTPRKATAEEVAALYEELFAAANANAARAAAGKRGA
jgi:alcohol dehydrogenase class IV